MNNKFIPIISVFMTISLVVFVSMQLYWLREYYSALEQDFSNKVYTSMNQVREKVINLEVQKYFSSNGNSNILDSIRSNSKQPIQQNIQVITDSANNKRLIAFSKNILERKDIPLPTHGDSIEITNLYQDEGLIRMSNPTAPMTAKLNKDLSSNDFTLKQLVKVNAANMPIEERIDPSQLAQLIRHELQMKGIDTPFGFAVYDKNKKLTEVNNSIFIQNIDKQHYKFELFSDQDFKTLYSLNLVFPQRNFALVENNLPMLLGTILSLLAILVIYIISINYMTRQKKVSEIKTDFINNMSHEFKTPIATIAVATDSLNNDKIATNAEKVKYYSSLIKQENLRMKKQVENVLNMSKLERNEVKLFLKKTDIRALIKSIAASFALIIEQRGGTLKMDLEAENHEIPIDEFHLSNTLINLLDNANKYSPESPQILIATWNEDHWFCIEISDEGMGMNAHNKNKIFEKFFREETGNIHNVKGQGLGLSYVKKIVELHHGTIHVESEKGKGSTFIIKLPIKS